MAGTTIHKTTTPGEPTPELLDYISAHTSFSWDLARTEHAALPAGRLNIAWEAVDRQVRAGRGNIIALIWLVKTANAAPSLTRSLLP